MPAPIGTQNIDAISRTGHRYSIKSTSSKVTGVFYGLNPKGSAIPDEKCFEYLILCLFNNEYKLSNIYQLDWETFLKHKKWHSRMLAWNLTITKNLLNDCREIYSA